VSPLLHAPTTQPLAPIIDTLARVRAQRGPAPVHGFTADLVVPAGADGWLPAAEFTSGERLTALLDAAHQRWNAAPHAAAALAFKSYAYWLALPAVVGYASARRVPLVSPDNVLVRPHAGAPFVELGLARPALAALADDPVTALHPGVLALPDDAALLGYLRRHLLDGHLRPLLSRLHERVRIGERTLLGSVASGIAYALARSADALPGPVAATAREILRALELDDLVEIDDDLGIRRHTCCLAFTLPTPKVCSGCCLPR
jgi:Ferric iron reductase FhuF-like transporter